MAGPDLGALVVKIDKAPGGSQYRAEETQMCRY